MWVGGLCIWSCCGCWAWGMAAGWIGCRGGSSGGGALGGTYRAICSNRAACWIKSARTSGAMDWQVVFCTERSFARWSRWSWSAYNMLDTSRKVSLVCLVRAEASTSSRRFSSRFCCCCYCCWRRYCLSSCNLLIFSIRILIACCELVNIPGISFLSVNNSSIISIALVWRISIVLEFLRHGQESSSSSLESSPEIFKFLFCYVLYLKSLRYLYRDPYRRVHANP